MRERNGRSRAFVLSELEAAKVAPDVIVAGSILYVRGNVRVISDHANRLKGNRNAGDLARLASHGTEVLREGYRRLHAYVEREALLAQVRHQAGNSRQRRGDWQRVAAFFERLCERGFYDA